MKFFKKNLFSIVIPVYNEEWNLFSLFLEIQKVFESEFNKEDYEIIFVNDWSTDKSLDELNIIKSKNTKVKIIDLQRNYWQSTALQAWFDNCNWNYIITLDWDWQNNPRDIKSMYDKLIRNNLDVVCWYRKERKDSWIIKFISKCARFLRRKLLNDKIHDSWCTLRIYKKECVEELNLYWEFHRYIAEILQIKWFKVWEIVVNHRERKFWKSKYNCFKMIKWTVDLLYIWYLKYYQYKPLHLFWWIWIISIIIWIIWLFFSLSKWLILMTFWWINLLWWLILEVINNHNFQDKNIKRYKIKNVE